MSQILGPEVQLNGNLYRLNRKDPLNATMPQGRNWQVEKVRQTAKREARGYISQDAIPDEFVAAYGDWSRGCTGEYEPYLGKHHLAYNVNTFKQGALLSLGQPQRSAKLTNNDFTSRAFLVYYPTISSLTNGFFVISGRYAYRLDAAGAITDTLDMGAGTVATDAILWNDLLLIACGDSAHIKTIPSGDLESVSTDDSIHAYHFTIADGLLWRSYTNASAWYVSCIQPGEDPYVATWSAGIAVGHGNCAVTDLNTYGVQIAVSKTEGLFLGDSNAKFTNVFPFLEDMPDADNGCHTLVVGDRIYYPHADGLLMYSQGASAEVGPHKQLGSACTSDASVLAPGLKIRALCQGERGSDLWVATDPPVDLPILPDVLYSSDGGSTIVDRTSVLTDSDLSTTFQYTMEPALATDDYLYIGYGSSKFYGISFKLVTGNDTSTSYIIADYWNGTDWVNTNVGATLTSVMEDTAQSGSYPMARSGVIVLNSEAMTGTWAKNTLASKNRYWVRLKLSGGEIPGDPVAFTLSEVRISTSTPQGIIWHVRPSESADGNSSPLTWTPVFSDVSPIAGPLHDLRLAYANSAYLNNRFVMPALMGTNRNYMLRWQLPDATPWKGYIWPATSAGYLVSARDDLGNDLSKQILNISVLGNKVDASHTYDLYYRLDNNVAWVTAASAVNTSPSSIDLSGVSGKRLQYMLSFYAAGTDTPTEINQVQVRYRELPSYKCHYTMIIELADNQYGGNQEPLPTPDVQLANLEACLSAGPLTLIDPLGRSKTVTVYSVKELEVAQGHNEYPYLLVEVRAAEV